MHNSVPFMKNSLSANVQLNSTNFNFNLNSSLTSFFHRALQLMSQTLNMLSGIKTACIKADDQIENIQDFLKKGLGSFLGRD